MKSDFFNRAIYPSHKQISNPQTAPIMARISTTIGCKLRHECTLFSSHLSAPILHRPNKSPCSSINRSITPSSPTSKFSFLPIGAQFPAAESPSSPNDLPLPESTPSSPLVPRDPLTWFGILVPPALRQAQNNFKPAAEDITPQMAGVALQMKELEIEIRRTRKKMGKLGNAG